MNKHPIRNARQRGQHEGNHKGYAEGYIRGRSQFIMHTVHANPDMRQIHVMYVSSGKGFPYSPLDEAIVTTLQSTVAHLSIAGPRDPVAQTAAQIRPDLVLVLDGMEFPVEQLNELRQSGIRTAVWITDDPYYTDIMTLVVPHYDYVFTLELNCVEYYRLLGCKHVHYLPFGVFPLHFRPRHTISPVRRDVSFIGSGYWNRIRSFNPIISRLATHNIVISGLWWDRLTHFSRYKKRIELNKWMGPHETATLYNGSKIVINMHRSVEDETVNNNKARIPAVSPNPRTFEISGCGTLQLTDVRADLPRFYTPGVEIETYRSSEELVSKVEYYLHNEEARREIALRSLERTMREHTYMNRINELLRVVFDPPSDQQQHLNQLNSIDQSNPFGQPNPHYQSNSIGQSN
ncbi:glycosyltransferase [Paenibacillus sp. 481]|nr:glycosyltransferase [Paenibacillus sp. 481]UHA75858.1 glycosyltransferase [Paenibacillus sp. 481]